MLKHVTLVVAVTLLSAADAGAQTPPLSNGGKPSLNANGQSGGAPSRPRTRRRRAPRADAPFEIPAAPPEADVLTTPIRDPELLFTNAGRVVHAFCDTAINTTEHRQSAQDSFICNNLAPLRMSGLSPDSHGSDAVRLLGSVARNYGYSVPTGTGTYIGALDAAEAVCRQALRGVARCPLSSADLRRNYDVAGMQAYVADVIAMVLYTTSANFRHFNNDDFQRLLLERSSSTGEEAEETPESLDDFLSRLGSTETDEGRRLRARREAYERAGRPDPREEAEANPFTFEVGPPAESPTSGSTESGSRRRHHEPEHRD